MAIVALSDKWPIGSKQYDENYKCVVFEKPIGSDIFKIGYKVDMVSGYDPNIIFVYVIEEKISMNNYIKQKS